MKETGLQGKACMVPVTVAAVLGMAGMGLVSMGIAAADTVTDTINITVQPSCTFNSVEDKTYAGSAANGTEVNNFTESGVHEFNLFCNDNNGFEVTATPYDLEATGIEDVISYTDNYTHTGVDSMWTAVIASDDTSLTVTSPVPVGGGTIVSSDTHTSAGGTSFTATYSAYVGTATPAGTYTGTIVYTLAATGATSSNNNSGTGTNNNGDNGGGTNDNNGGGTEEPGETNEQPGGTDNSNGGGTGGGNEEPNNTEPTNNSPSFSPQSTTLNNSYSTYNTTNTYNTYNTTNYQGGGSAPVVANATPAATNDNIGDTTNEDTNNSTTTTSDANAEDDYEKPLGVMSTTSSMPDKGTGMDPMPIVATGALTMAGVAAIALARSGKKEEE